MTLTSKELLVGGITAIIALGLLAQCFPTLRYVGYAFASGVIVTLTGILSLLISISRGKARGVRLGPRVVRIPTFSDPEKWRAEITALTDRAVFQKDPLYPASSEVSDRIDVLLNRILRDFIATWYNNISRSPSFVNEVNTVIRVALVEIRDRASTLDVVRVTISRVIPIITSHLKDFYDAERAVRGKHLNRSVTESDELDLAIARRYRNGILHPAASFTLSDPKVGQQEYLRLMISKILPSILPSHVLNSRAVRVLVTEIVACGVLTPVMQILSDPDTWNVLMEAYGRTMLHDRKSVRKLRAALDEHASPAPKRQLAPNLPRLSANDNERKFERFLRSVRRCNNLPDARRFRADVAFQLKREADAFNRGSLYFRRLEIAKEILDRKVVDLATDDAVQSTTNRPSVDHDYLASRLEGATLPEILRDASGLSYFMEYMDRKGLMTLVQFWIVVDGLRQPLEDDALEDDDFLSRASPWTESDRTDIVQINESYMSKPELGVPEGLREAVRIFIKAGRQATPIEYQRARKAILKAQTSVLEEMQTGHFEDFKRSDLYYKLLTAEASFTGTSARASHRPIDNTGQNIPAKSRRNFAHEQPANTERLESGPLRRTAVSSMDLQSSHLLEESTPARRSLDYGVGRPLFSEDSDVDILSRSTYSLDSDLDGTNSQAGPDKNIVQAMEAALNDIIEEKPGFEDTKSPIFTDSIAESTFSGDNESSRGSFESGRPINPTLAKEKEKEKPSIASLGLVNPVSRSGVFAGEDLFPGEERFIEDEREDSIGDEAEGLSDEEIHEAAPGDLGLAEAISALSTDIEKLQAQSTIVDSLTRKAELTNNVAELRILRKSISSLQREMKRKELQRQQYIIQESDNSLFGRATVAIKSIMVGNDEEGHEFALYVIEVERRAGEYMRSATWAIARRYSEFHALHQTLRRRFPSVRNMDFPRRRVVMKLQQDFLQKRRIALENYLKNLLLLPDVCRSLALRAFLSQQAIITPDSNGDPQQINKSIINRLYNSVTDGMEEFLGSIPALDQLSLASQNFISTTNSQFGVTPTGVVEDPIGTDEAKAEMEAFENREAEPFIKPICDIFLEVFELNKGNSWLRGSAVVVVLHQLLGGTIERRVRDNAKMMLSEESLLRYIGLATDTMWPDGNLRKERKVRTSSEKAQSRREASLVLATLIPDLAASVVGRLNAQAASRRIFATLNNPKLNTHLAFTILDEVAHLLFPDVRL